MLSISAKEPLVAQTSTQELTYKKQDGGSSWIMGDKSVQSQSCFSTYASLEKQKSRKTTEAHNFLTQLYCLWFAWELGRVLHKISHQSCIAALFVFLSSPIEKNPSKVRNRSIGTIQDYTFDWIFWESVKTLKKNLCIVIVHFSGFHQWVIKVGTLLITSTRKNLFQHVPHSKQIWP